ncbi:MAG: hypothetical protein R2688_04440 [Fimbriimonadaceae bacterium]
MLLARGMRDAEQFRDVGKMKDMRFRCLWLLGLLTLSLIGCSTAKKLAVNNSPKSIENAVPESLQLEPNPNEKWVAWQFAQPLPELDEEWQAMLLDPFNESQIARIKGKDEFQRKFMIG